MSETGLVCPECKCVVEEDPSAGSTKSSQSEISGDSTDSPEPCPFCGSDTVEAELP